tara:strand:+ start:9949 stop:10119 length:171 start_codon:yes stop_codon:yes gene_type:complete
MKMKLPEKKQTLNEKNILKTHSEKMTKNREEKRIETEQQIQAAVFSLHRAKDQKTI